MVGYLLGTIFVPGGHEQFNFWYIHLIPLAIEMVGLPFYISFWVYQWCFPSLDMRFAHHYAHMLIVFILLTKGARK